MDFKAAKHAQIDRLDWDVKIDALSEANLSEFKCSLGEKACSEVAEAIKKDLPGQVLYFKQKEHNRFDLPMAHMEMMGIFDLTLSP